MRLWRVERTEAVAVGYDEYDAAIIAAETAADAMATKPSEYTGWDGPVTAAYVGEAALGTMPGVVLASFNAG